MQVYTDIQRIECLQGDTLPAFTVTVDADVSGTMDLILAAHSAPEAAVLVKECTAQDSGVYTVTLTSSDTEALHGVFEMHFCLTVGDNKYRKLMGELFVRPCPKGGA